ncbi:plasmolipin-like isoform X2 [Scleropages formosus]|uniref:plasmolipin-like isoform X2 n=1 Tax=Scleropages formosus TaxID=113540 RepID=UPI000878108B|nr:plasmolipin-like isoform X2 [Scleropages formosus]
MAEFPAKVSTQTSSPAAQRAIGSGSKSIVLQYVSVDLHFLGSVPGILLLAEIVLGLLTWSLTASTSYTCVPAYGWVMFISITLWILTVTLFCILFLGIQQKLSFLPWQLMVLLFNGVAALVYLTAFLANASFVTPFSGTADFNPLAAAVLFAVLVTLVYSMSTFFALMAWRGDSGITANTTVPV